MASSFIGLTGYKRSGKDTAGAHLVASHGYTRLALADPIKAILAAIDPLVEGKERRTRDDDSGTVPKKALDESQRIINAISGEIARRGLLVNPTEGRIRPATKMARILNPYCVPVHKDETDRLSTHLAAVHGDWNQLKDEELPAHREIRRLQQVFGTEAGRSVFGEDLWIRLLFAAAATIEGPVVVTDIRFDNEAKAIRDAGGTVIKIHRPDLAASGDIHASEAGVSKKLIDTTIVNDGELERLYVLLDTVVGAPVLAA
ncbi:hypothetical protein GCM10011374_36200 [Kocuria dechangensis]|uniref:Deoxynucleotide monophosphate kinase n=1 Tax=Kocuria dechangensis TaxID=1176249 RepID=A0A917LZU7_9MICC|nr:hypothetical protein [Kocuria dechangensis]GGG68590.1 hypothetical protein GCM10011374_36200 [Kocuria dechangensis]